MKNPTIAKINSFKDLPENWSFGEGVVFDSSQMEKAINLVNIAYELGLKESDAFPGLNGEIMVTFYDNEDYWELILEPNNSVTYVYERGEDTSLYQEELSFDVAFGKLIKSFKNNHLSFYPSAIQVFKSAESSPKYRFINKSSQPKWRLSGSFTSDIMIGEKKGLKVQPLRTLQVGEYPFLVENAQQNAQKPSVNISKNSTHPQLVVPRQYSGEFRNRSYQVVMN
jgi:hypothetical protein